MRFGQRQRRRGATALRREPPASPGAWKVVWSLPLRWLGVALALAAVGFGVRFASEKLREPGAFPLRQVRIEGELRNLAEEDFQPIVRGYLGQNFFDADLDALHGELAVNPWIEEVAVRRGWPDTVEITLRERVAFGYWGEREMVDVNGHRFQPAEVRQPGPWPRLAGPDGHEKDLIRTYRQARALLDPVGLKLVKLVEDERRAWWLTFDSGLEVYLGREQFERRLQRLARIYPRILAAQAERIAAVDLRYVNGFAVRWKTGSPDPAAG
ncbi:MAG: cell division protein FtsQ/DivIB [Candidatus Competibacter sp.]|nr:cell division protein FtsQ/DivIB [Candidatus Competibacter sp.]MDG4584787.1 cell division protein FtsQ/DivIB [Candidatus Competibacter sp.]